MELGHASQKSAETVSVLAPAVEAGLKDAFRSELGSAESVTASLKPFKGVTLIVVDPEHPDFPRLC